MGYLSKGEAGTLRPMSLRVGSLRTAVCGQDQYPGLWLGLQGTREGWAHGSTTGVLKNQRDINRFRSLWVGQVFPALESVLAIHRVAMMVRF